MIYYKVILYNIISIHTQTHTHMGFWLSSASPSRISPPFQPLASVTLRHELWQVFRRETWRWWGTCRPFFADGKRNSLFPGASLQVVYIFKYIYIYLFVYSCCCSGLYFFHIPILSSSRFVFFGWLMAAFCFPAMNDLYWFTYHHLIAINWENEVLDKNSSIPHETSP